MSVTLKDIAMDVGTSVAAVSFALNGKSKSAGISKETTEKILETAKRLNYRPHLQARALRSGKTKTIGVLIPALSGIYWRRASFIQAECARNGYFAVFSLWHEKKEEDRACAAILERHPDAIISFTNSERLQESKVPVVYYSNPSPERDYATIDTDSYLRQAGREITKRGFRKILYCRKFTDAKYTRTLNLEKYLGENVQTVRLELKLSSNAHDTYSDAVFTAEKYFSEKNCMIPDIVVGTDEIVMGIGSVLQRRLGFRLPEDVALLGFDNLPSCEHYITPLSSFDASDAEFAEALYSLIIRRLKNPDAPPKHIKIKPRFVERESLNKKFSSN